MVWIRSEHDGGTTRMETQPTLQFDVVYPDRLSRLLIFVKWLLLIPHFIVLYFLGIVVYAITIIAFFAILITGGYPKGLFDFVVGYYRWSNRVGSYFLLMTDAYPPFGFDESTTPAPPPSEPIPIPQQPYF